MEKVIEVIDVDDLPEPSSDDSDIVFTGFKRDASKSQIHSAQLDTEGFVYVGFKDTLQEQKPLDCDSSWRPTPSSSKTLESVEPPSASMVKREVGIGVNVPRSESAKRPQPASNSGPPVKRRKR
ncbi:hypothetical protein C8Q73DRAFT_406171 [Cubamyces lactineus]|nr:hypothetical protein C8Q73DRAFT_406171 [Cubamyces lactineus]